MKTTLLVLLGLVFLILLLLFLGQGRLIYFPQRYAPDAGEQEKVETVFFSSGGSAQKFFLVPPQRSAPPGEVWWLFGGNGSVALNWVDLVSASGLRGDQVFVLFDYPGYGFNEGMPSDESIRRSIDEAFPVVAEHLGLTEEELGQRSRAIGHSLGAAVALETAARYEFGEVVMISPFTTLKAMAKRQVGPFLARFLSHHYDNETALDRWMKSSRAGRLTIFHGEGDRLIPIAMSRDLVERGGDAERITFVPVPDAGHNDIIMRIAPAVLRLVIE